MHVSALIEHGCRLLARVARLEQSAEAAVADFFQQHPRLGARERQALAQATYTWLRERLRLQHLAASRPQGVALERAWLLLAWDEAGEALERLQAACSTAEWHWRAQALAQPLAALPPACRHGLPDWLAQELRLALADATDANAAALTQAQPEGAVLLAAEREAELEAELEAAAAALRQSAPLDLRVNLLQTRRPALLAQLQAAGLQAQATPYSPWGLRLAGKPRLHALAAWRAGAFEVQDEGSQLLALLLEVRRQQTVVDFCAGAGGKTLALGALLQHSGHLYACDTSAHRLAALQPRLQRAGLREVHTLALAHEDDARLQRLWGKADRVLVDAPCSGLGTLRRQPDLMWRVSSADIAAQAGRQARVLAAAARLVKPGGRLVYATCSLLRAENEAVASAFTQAQRGFALQPAAAALQRVGVPDAAHLCQGAYLRLWPHRHGCDGFFAAIWQRCA